MEKANISIIDCGMGNLGSVVNIIEHIGHETTIISSPKEVLDAEKLIFPGVGHWDKGVERLINSGLKPAILKAVDAGTPLMGICLGMQLLFSHSEEGENKGLGLIPGRIKRFDFSRLPEELTQGRHKLRVPHMGWNAVTSCRINDPMLAGLDDDVSFYFVHSYHSSDVPSECQLLTCHYGYDFVCGVNQDNVWGFQFHPEKSHKFGMQLLKNFAGNL